MAQSETLDRPFPKVHVFLLCVCAVVMFGSHVAIDDELYGPEYAVLWRGLGDAGLGVLAIANLVAFTRLPSYRNSKFARRALQFSLVAGICACVEAVVYLGGFAGVIR